MKFISNNHPKNEFRDCRNGQRKCSERLVSSQCGSSLNTYSSEWIRMIFVTISYFRNCYQIRLWIIKMNSIIKWKIESLMSVSIKMELESISFDSPTTSTSILNWANRWTISNATCCRWQFVGWHMFSKLRDAECVTVIDNGWFSGGMCRTPKTCR